MARIDLTEMAPRRDKALRFDQHAVHLLQSAFSFSQINRM